MAEFDINFVMDVRSGHEVAYLRGLNNCLSLFMQIIEAQNKDDFSFRTVL